MYASSARFVWDLTYADWQTVHARHANDLICLISPKASSTANAADNKMCFHILCINHVAAELGHMTDRHKFVHFGRVKVFLDQVMDRRKFAHPALP